MKQPTPTPDGRSDRLVFLHGFTQTHHHWHRCALMLGRMRDRPTHAFVDLPGHGLSGDDTIEISRAGGPLAELVGRGTYIGYSMGGRFALHAAIARPHLVERLVLIGATPGIEDAPGRTERIEVDERRARRIEEVGVALFVDEWLSGPLFATLPKDRADIEHRRRNTAAGLATSLRTAGTGVQLPLWSSLSRLDIPVLALAGERDEKFTSIAERMIGALPAGTFRSIPDAGHAVHTERPRATAEVISEWIGATPVGRSPVSRAPNPP